MCQVQKSTRHFNNKGPITLWPLWETWHGSERHANPSSSTKQTNDQFQTPGDSGTKTSKPTYIIEYDLQRFSHISPTDLSETNHPSQILSNRKQPISAACVTLNELHWFMQPCWQQEQRWCRFVCGLTCDFTCFVLFWHVSYNMPLHNDIFTETKDWTILKHRKQTLLEQCSRTTNHRNQTEPISTALQLPFGPDRKRKTSWWSCWLIEIHSLHPTSQTGCKLGMALKWTPVDGKINAREPRLSSRCTQENDTSSNFPGQCI